MTPPLRLMLVDLYEGGHHRQYLEMLARAWCDRPIAGRLGVAAPGTLFARHPEFAAFIDGRPDRLLRVPIGPEHALPEGDMGLASVLANDFRHGLVVRELVREHAPERVLLMFADHAQASLAAGLRVRPRLSGLYFRPSFHYRDETGRPEEGPATRMRKRLLLAAALRNPSLDVLFCLDPDAVEAIGHPKLVWLPDGVDLSPPTRSRARVRTDWGIGEDTRVGLFFGVLSGRKGLHELARAMPRVPASVRDRSAIVFAGRIPDGERAEVDGALKSIGSVIRTHINERYVDEGEVQSLFQASDLALVAYRRHVGSSNVLVRAAAAGTPVVGSSHGLVGRQIARHRLGIAVDTGDSEALAGALETALSDAVDPRSFDPGTARRFARANASEAFAATVFGALFDAQGT